MGWGGVGCFCFCFWVCCFETDWKVQQRVGWEGLVSFVGLSGHSTVVTSWQLIEDLFSTPLRMSVDMKFYLACWCNTEF
ncbi:hypothetical protein F5B17DRAFT_424891, partial [Nemania serpens]